MSKCILTLIAAALIAAPVGAAPKLTRPAAVTALDACRKLIDDAARLVCYDRAVSALTDAVSSGDVAVVDREQMVKTRRSLFGFTLPDLPLLRGQGRKEEPELKKIASTIVSSSAVADGRYRMTLADSDAVWETTENSDSLSPPRRGDKVTIEKGAMGAYFIQVGSQRWVRGRRVR